MPAADASAAPCAGVRVRPRGTSGGSRHRPSAASASASFDDRRRQPHRRQVEGAGRAELRAEELHGVGQFQRATCRRRPRPACWRSCWRRRTCPQDPRPLPACTIRLSCAIGTSCCSTIHTAQPVREFRVSALVAASAQAGADGLGRCRAIRFLRGAWRGRGSRTTTRERRARARRRVYVLCLPPAR